MYKIVETPEFQKWIDSIRDISIKIRLTRRLGKAKNGNLGDIKAIGEGLYEMREHFGSGWQMYYTIKGNIIIVMLGGGIKSTQSSDIKAVKKLLKVLED
jgi:putative addiction module killer protein